MTVSHHHRIAQSPALRYLLVFLFAAIAVAPGISSLPPLDRNEPRFTQATKQMLETGDYVDIRFQHEARYQKPVGIYWMQVAAIKAAGYGPDAPIWVYRLVSVLAIAIAAAGLAWTGTNLFGGNAGLISGIILAAVMATAFEGRNAKADAMLLASCVIAQGALAQIYVRARNGQAPGARLPLIFWIAQGVGIIIKGPFTPLVSALTIGTLWIFERDGRWLRQLHVLRGLLIIAAIGLPWLVMIMLRSGTAFLETSLGNDLLMKTVPGQQPHGAPPGYYVVTYSLFLWPFGVIALGAGLHALNRFREEPAIAFCLAWYMPFWLLFELIPTKQPHYVLPAYPGLLLLVGWLATQTREVAEARLAGWQRLLYGASVCGLAAVTVGLAIAAVGAPLYLGLPFNWWSVPTAVAALVAGYLGYAVGHQASMRRVVPAAMAAAVTFGLFATVVVPQLSPLWLTPRIKDAVSQNRPCTDSILASANYLEPSLIFLLGTQTITTDLAGVEQHLAANPACALGLAPVGRQSELAAWLAAHGLAPRKLSEIDGLNYSSRERLALGLYAAQRR